ncbi:hypothetical protein CsSME_00006174 [Camellia sinensis var. sinensis]
MVFQIATMEGLLGLIGHAQAVVATCLWAICIATGLDGWSQNSRRLLPWNLNPNKTVPFQGLVTWSMAYDNDH